MFHSKVRDKVTRQCPRTTTSVCDEKDEEPTEAAVSGYGGGGRGRLYTYRYSHSLSVTTRMTSALRWAAMRTILMFQ